MLSHKLLAASKQETANPNAWDPSFLENYGGPLGVGGVGVRLNNDGTRLFLGSGNFILPYKLNKPYQVHADSNQRPRFSVSTQETQPYGVEFKPDGTKMYVVGWVGDDINEYNLSTAWDVTSASYVQIKSVSAQATTPAKVRFKNDGTRMYVLNQGTGRVFQYDLSTAWNVSTATYNSVVYIHTAELANAYALFFGDNGSKMYLDGGSVVYQYTLSTPWDISTASYASKSFNHSTQETGARDVAFTADGTKMYVIGLSGDDINQYALSTAWDVSTATYTKVSPVLTTGIGGPTTGELNPQGMYFKQDGKVIYFVGTSSIAVWQLCLSTAEDVATIGLGLYVQDVAPGHTGFAFKPDGTELYVVSDTNNAVYKYTLSTAWDLFTASYSSVSYSVAARHTVPQDIDFKPDGTQFFIIDSNLDEIAPYNMSTPWDISTASFAGAGTVFSCSGSPYSETAPTGIAFNSTGTVLFFVGQTTDRIFALNLSTPWDLTSVNSYKTILLNSTVQSISGYANRFTHFDSAPTGVCISADNNEILILGSIGVYRFKLGAASSLYIDTSTFPANQTTSNYLAVPAFITSNMKGIRFSADGRYIYGGYSQSGEIVQIDLGVYGAPYRMVLPTVTAGITVGYPYCQDIWIDPTGTHIYFLGDGFDGLAHYTMSTPWMISTATLVGSTYYVNGSSASASAVYPHCFYITEDRTQMFAIDDNLRGIRQYSFGTPGDVSTISFVRQKAITGPNSRGGMSFKPDGTRFIYGGNGNFYVYDLSTPWDVSTATLTKTTPIPGMQFGNTTTATAQWTSDGTRVLVSTINSNNFTQLVIE